MARAGARTARTKKAAQPRRILNLLPSKDTAKDWTISTAIAAGALRAVALPRSVDLRAPWWKVGNQGETGSCVGWATADSVMRYLLVQAGRLPKTEPLSVRHVWMASKETDEFTTRPETFIEESGTSLKSAADILRKHGVALDRELPFALRDTMFVGSIDTFYASAATRKIASYFNARKNTDEWKKALAAGRPILAALNVDANWSDAADTGGKLDRFRAGTVRGGHAISIVGYRADGRFIIRNSWGTDWGDQGFAYASAAYIRAAFFDESYVLTL